MSTERKLNPVITMWSVQALTRLTATFAILQGIAIIVGGPERWRGLSFQIALMVPGSPPTWGYLILVAGIVAAVGTFTGSMRAVSYSMFIATAWSGMFAITFIIGAILHGESALTAIVTYSMIAIWFAILGVVYRESQKDLDSTVE